MAIAKAYRAPAGAVLRFTGEDHADFLQGQGTADLRGSPGLSRYSLWLDHRGQVQGDGFILRESEEAMLLISYDSDPGKLIAKFDRHIIADDVEVEDLTDQFDIVSVLGLEPDQGPVPEVDSFQMKDEIRSFAGRRLGRSSIDFLIPQDGPLPLNASLITEQEMVAIRIESGIPSVSLDVVAEQLNPLEANLISPLSFDKGCYLGQEVVARVHRLQRVTKRLIRLTQVDGDPPVAGPIMLEGSPVGHITSIAVSSDQSIAIGWLKSRFSDGEIAFDNARFKVETLPAS